jgi:hypothetical protein
MIWGLRRGCLIGPNLIGLALYAGASGFYILSQWGERPERLGESFRFETSSAGSGQHLASDRIP